MYISFNAKVIEKLKYTIEISDDIESLEFLDSNSVHDFGDWTMQYVFGRGRKDETSNVFRLYFENEKDVIMAKLMLP